MGGVSTRLLVVFLLYMLVTQIPSVLASGIRQHIGGCVLAKTSWELLREPWELSGLGGWRGSLDNNELLSFTAKG